MKQVQTSSLRNETASRLFVSFMQIIGNIVSKDKNLDDDYIDNFLFKASPHIAKQSIKLADIFIQALKDNDIAENGVRG